MIQKTIKHEESESKILYKRFWDGPCKLEECRQACSTLSRHKSKFSHPNKIKWCAVLTLLSNFQSIGKDQQNDKVKKQNLTFYYNHFHNILRLFDVLTNFSFTTSETMRDYYYKHGIYKLPLELPNDLRKVGNIRNVFKPHRMMAQCLFPLQKWTFC